MSKFWGQVLVVSLIIVLGLSNFAWAQNVIPIPRVNLGIESSSNPKDVALTLQIMLLFTLFSLAPAFLVMMTSFTRIITVLSFLRKALATQPEPSNQILVGLALFLTLYIMMPVWQEINDKALQPYMKKEIAQDVALKNALAPLRVFMFKQCRKNDLALMVNLTKSPRPRNKEDIPTLVLVPAFVISELKTSFQMGFIIYIPFLVIDMVVASVLMSMGMMMLPPVMISMPFKILLFVMVDGWHLLIRALITSFN